MQRVVDWERHHRRAVRYKEVGLFRPGSHQERVLEERNLSLEIDGEDGKEAEVA